MADHWREVQVDSSEQECMNNFEDNFVTLDRLPDSEQYVDRLEKKLANLKKSNLKKDQKTLLSSLAEVKSSHLETLVSSGSNIILNDLVLDETINRTALFRVIAPSKQANTVGELVELLKHDQLAQTLEELEINEELTNHKPNT